jgi:hypothetical protein
MGIKFANCKDISDETIKKEGNNVDMSDKRNLNNPIETSWWDIGSYLGYRNGEAHSEDDTKYNLSVGSNSHENDISKYRHSKYAV